ncbi:MAG: DUF4342 domain-containing protein [Candidatus Krumholzibacteria bacterium]|jgi:hypothetical protein|nr:DUF4342 domain-containing protein [Candidatus Krumholzibacteria bacterium]
MDEKKTRTEEFEVDGDKIVETVKRLVREGNIRRITIKDAAGMNLIEIPLTLGVVGTVLVPVLAAVGALAALVTHCSIVVERIDK